MFHWLHFDSFSQVETGHISYETAICCLLLRRTGGPSYFSPWFLHHGVWVCSVLPRFPTALIQVLQLPAGLPMSFLFSSNHLILFPVFWSFGSSDGNQEHFRVLCPVSVFHPSLTLSFGPCTSHFRLFNEVLFKSTNKHWSYFIIPALKFST